MTYYSQNCSQTFSSPAAEISAFLKRKVCQWLYDNRLKSSIQRERMSLVSMSDEMLKDIGIDRFAANRESACRDMPATRKDTNIA